MVVQHNLTALNTSRMLNVTNGRKAKSAEKLSSGYRINRAADDAAGLSISEKMRKQVRGLERGVDNTLDGISLCQVMDGALHEVTSMVQRVSELSIQAANGTNSDSDRAAIQSEVDAIVSEINRIGETTKFNEIYPFKLNSDQISQIQGGLGNTEVEGDIPFSDFKLADMSLGTQPFGNTSTANELALVAIVDKEGSAFDGKTYRMIFGDGSTSYPSFKVDSRDENGNSLASASVSMNALRSTDYSYDADSKTWSRTFSYSTGGNIDISIVQTVQIEDTSDTEKNYKIAYRFENNVPNTNVDVEFLFHADTAYNNIDSVEGYFIDGNRVEKTSVYTTPGSALTDGQTNSNIYEDTTVPSSFSIVDVDNTLAFAEKISFSGTGDSVPKTVSIGMYYENYLWDYYGNGLDSYLGQNTKSQDLGFALYYTGEMSTTANSTNNSAVTFSFNYGIVATEADTNLNGVVTNKNQTKAPIDYSKPIEAGLWIQSGCEANDGMHITMRVMNADAIGLGKADLSTEKGAEKVIDATKEALRRVSEHRSIIGAQQNRLEHTVANEENIVENTTAAESRIRDTDMAEEMVQLSMTNILAQAGQAMLAQANQSTQGVLSLLQ